MNFWWLDRKIGEASVLCIKDYCTVSRKHRVRMLVRQGDACSDPSWLPSPETKDAVLNCVLHAGDSELSQQELLEICSEERLQTALTAFRKGMQESESLRRQVMSAPTIRKGLVGR